MKKITTVLVLVCMLLVVGANTSFAMSAKELNNLRWEMRNTLDNAEMVSWDDLNNSPDSYVNRTVRFKGVCVGISDGGATIGFKNPDGNLLIVMNAMAYRFKLDAEYEISASFVRMVPGDETSNNNRVGILKNEQAHLPMMSEYGL